jgi:hypothetical protein
MRASFVLFSGAAFGCPVLLPIRSKRRARRFLRRTPVSAARYADVPARKRPRSATGNGTVDAELRFVLVHDPTVRGMALQGFQAVPQRVSGRTRQTARSEVPLTKSWFVVGIFALWLLTLAGCGQNDPGPNVRRGLLRSTSIPRNVPAPDAGAYRTKPPRSPDGSPSRPTLR